MRVYYAQLSTQLFVLALALIWICRFACIAKILYAKSGIDKIPYADIPIDKIPYADIALCPNSDCRDTVQPF